MRIARLALVSLLGVLLVAGLACGQQQASENTGGFGIYLANLSWRDFGSYCNCSDVQNVALLEEPIVSTGDIISYNWSSHYIELTEEGCSQFIERLQESGWIYTPFVVVANGEPIYKGVFYSTVSSFSEPYCPSVFEARFESCDYTDGYEGFTIHPAGWLTSTELNESDVRYDSRIYQALKQAGKLIE